MGNRGDAVGFLRLTVTHELDGAPIMAGMVGASSPRWARGGWGWISERPEVAAGNRLGDGINRVRVRSFETWHRLRGRGDLGCLGHVALSLSGSGFAYFASALCHLGVSWNCLYIGAAGAPASGRAARRIRLRRPNSVPAG